MKEISIFDICRWELTADDVLLNVFSRRRKCGRWESVSVSHYGEVIVEWYTSETAEVVTTTTFAVDDSAWRRAMRYPLVAAKYLGLAKKAEPSALNHDVSKEPWLFKDRPALAEYMTVVVLSEGRLREPSVIMIGVSDEGIRAGIKDEDAGGWCWRAGKTLAGALDALEKALASGEAVFRPVGGGKPGRGKR